MGQIVCTDKGILAVEQNKVLIPPTWNKTFAWGYADLSCRLGTYESDKVCILSFSFISSCSYGWAYCLMGVEKAQAKGLSTGPPRPRGRESRKRSERTSHASYRTSLLGQVVFWGLAVPLPLLELLQEALASQAVSISYSQRASFGESLPGPLISVLLND